MNIQKLFNLPTIKMILVIATLFFLITAKESGSD